MKTQICLLVYVSARITTLNFLLWNSNSSFANGFVNISANWSLDLQGFKWTSSLLTSSLIKWYLVSICLLFWWNTLFLDSAINDLLSQYIVVDPCCCYSNPSDTLLNHTSWHVAKFATTYSSSADDSVTIGCFLDAHEITPEPIWNTLPDVLFLSSKLPEKSLFLNPIDRKSTSSYVFHPGSGVISLASKKQNFLTLSSVEE